MSPKHRPYRAFPPSAGVGKGNRERSTDTASDSAKTLTRRSFVGAGMAAGAGLAMGFPAQAEAAPVPYKPRTVPLGGEIQHEFHDSDPAYREVFLDYCDMIMPGNALKFGLIHPEPDRWIFDRADRMVAFARDNGRTCRGTCHVWWNETPDWIEPLSSRQAEAALIDHIERLTDRYKGQLESWDVVNEVIANDPIYSGYALRKTTWLEKLGPRHIPIAFKATANADPGVGLVINDYDLEFVGPIFDARREIMLSLVRQLQDENIKVTGVGIQGHLYAGRSIDKDALESFHKTLDGLGVELLVTELDVIDWETRPDDQAMDQTAYGLVADLLDGVFAWKAPKTVIVWGISDRYSWVNDVMERPDGHPARPLPLDRDLKPKNWMGLLEKRLA